MKALMLALFFSMVFLMTEAHGFVFYHSDTLNGSLCRQPDPMRITYFNGALATDSYQVALAAESWNDAPTLVHLSINSSLAPATIVVQTVKRADLIWLGQTSNSPAGIVCTNGYIITPLAISVNDAQITNVENSNPSINDNDFRIGVIAHEMGHALGLAHPQTLCSLMHAPMVDTITSCGGVFFPTVDDIKGAAALYGWASDTSFAGTAVSSSSNTVSSTTPQLSLRINPSAAGAYAKVYTSSSLPSSNIAILTGYVTPVTLYRFHIGWQANSHVFSSSELDNDGAKLVDWPGTCCRVQNINSSFTPAPLTSYFIELVIEKLSSGSVRTHTYVYQGSMQTANGAELFDGHLSDDLTNSCFLCTTTSASWSDADSFEASVWTDSGSNPASAYSLDHFWNFQSGAKSSAPPFIDSDAFNSNAYVGVQTNVNYSVHSPTAFITSVSTSWGDGYTSTGSFYFAPSASGTLYHTYSAPGLFTVVLTATDDAGQKTSFGWTVTVGDFSISASPPALTIQQASSGTSNLTLTSINGFSDWILIQSQQTPASLSVNFDKTLFVLPTGGTASVKVFISTGSTSPGTYTVSVTFAGVNRPTSHTVNIPITVSSIGGGGGSGGGGTCCKKLGPTQTSYNIAFVIFSTALWVVPLFVALDIPTDNASRSRPRNASTLTAPVSEIFPDILRLDNIRLCHSP